MTLGKIKKIVCEQNDLIWVAFKQNDFGENLIIAAFKRNNL